MPGPLRFFFDFISPYAYLGWHRVRPIARAHGRDVEPVPVLFAALLDHFGQLGPAEIAPKRVYTFKQCVRRAARRGIAFALPPAHPFNPLLGLRIASLTWDEGDRGRVIDALFAGAWGDATGITDPVQVASRLDALGFAGATAVAAAQLPEAKARVREQTQLALSEGVFGVPTVIADGELFWGDDALDDLDVYLRGEDPVTPEVLAAAAGLPVGATRPRAGS